nr:RNA-directed DNA polymerase, eukaryota [Tanacetum cinerariifolium]
MNDVATISSKITALLGGEESKTTRRRARDGAESNQWFEFCSMLDSVTLSSSSDRIFCDLNGEGEFRVKDIRSSIDDTFLPSSDSATRWVKNVPIKVNILAWRTRLDRLPTRVNLIMRGVNIESSLCPVYTSVQEDSNHLFFLCDLAGLSLSVFRLSSNSCRRVFFIHLGGISGPSGTVLSLILLRLEEL